MSVLRRFSFSSKAGRVTLSTLLLLLAGALIGAASAAILPVTKSAEQLLQASGNAYQQGRYLQSAELAKRLLATDHSPNLIRRHAAFNLLAQAQTRLGDYPHALEALTEAGLLARRQRLRKGMALTEIFTGDVYERLKQHPAALEHYRAGLARLRLPTDWREARLVLLQIGDIQVVEGDFEKAQANYAQGLRLAERADDAAARAQSLDYMGFFYRRIGDTEKAIAAHTQALRQAGRIADRAERERAFARAYNHLGLSQQLLATQTENADEALKLIRLAITNEEKAVQHARQAEDRWRQGYVLRALTQLHLQLAKASGVDGAQALRAAERHARLAFDLAREMNNPEWEGLALHALALVHARSGAFAAAEATMEQAQTIWERIGDHYSRGIGLRLRSEEIDVPSGNLAPARANLLAALQAFQQVRAPDDMAYVNYLLSRQFAQQGNRAVAIYFGKQAVNTVQSMRERLRNLDRDSQQAFVRVKGAIYRHLADLLIDDGRVVEAQQVVAMLKEEEFFDFVRRDARRDVRSTSLGLTGEENAWQTLQQQGDLRIAALGAEQEELRRKAKVEAGLSEDEKARLAAIGEKLRVARSTFEQYLGKLLQDVAKKGGSERNLEVGEKNLANLRALQGSLHELGQRSGGAVAVLHYVVTEDRLHIIMTTSQIQMARSIKIAEKTLNRKIGAFRTALEGLREDFLPLAQELHQLLIAPVAEDLKQARVQTLMVSLDGALRYLPLAALHDGEHYLVEDYRLAMFTEAAKDKLKDPPSPQWRIAGLGVTLAVQGFVALPGVKDELAGIVKSSTGSGIMPGEVHLDQEFTAGRIKQSLDYPVLHIASHFVFQPGTEADSYLLLGDSSRLSLKALKEDDYDFRDVDLITLSACQTAVGGGKDENGREIEGFGALAQRQGAKGVIATLWPVADASTGLFMREFYRLRQTEKLSKAEAMRRAQMILLKGRGDAGKIAECAESTTSACFAHPFYWAPFILMGNWL